MTSLHDSSGNRKYLNIGELRVFYAAVQSMEDDKRRGFVLTLFHTGCRLSEALGLQTDNIDQSEQSLIFRTLKQRGNTHHRAVPVPKDLIKLLLSWPHEKGRVFDFGRTTAWSEVKGCMERAGLSSLTAAATPRGLRHSFAIACVAENVPLPKISRWLGHTRLETTAIYVDYVGEDERKFARRVWSKTTGKKG